MSSRRHPVSEATVQRVGPWWRRRIQHLELPEVLYDTYALTRELRDAEHPRDWENGELTAAYYAQEDAWWNAAHDQADAVWGEGVLELLASSGAWSHTTWIDPYAEDAAQAPYGGRRATLDEDLVRDGFRHTLSRPVVVPTQSRGMFAVYSLEGRRALRPDLVASWTVMRGSPVDPATGIEAVSPGFFDKLHGPALIAERLGSR